MITAVEGRAAHIIVKLLPADRRGISQVDVESGGRRPRCHQQIIGAEERDHAPIKGGALAFGAGNVGRGLGQTALGVPDDVGFQFVAVAPELQLAIDDEMLARRIWNASSAAPISGEASSTMHPSSANRRAALVQISRTSRSIGMRPL